MAPRTRAVALICSSCQSAQVRQFSRAVPRQSRAFPEFAPTSQSELDSLLSQFREELFVPESLSKAHKRLMYRPTKHHLLTGDAGVTVSVSDEEEVKLVPKAITDRPKKRKAIAQIAKLLGETDNPEAWSNLKPFLEGMKTAHWQLPSHTLEQITRKARKLGKERVLIECAEQASSTDARLTRPMFTRELLHGCHERAVQASFKGDDYEKAARQAHNIIKLLDRDDHCGNRKTALPLGHFDMRKSLFVNSILLEMTASRLLAASNSPTDATGDVGRAVARVLALSSPQEPGLGDFEYPEFRRIAKEDRSRAPMTPLSSLCSRMENLIVTWSGMKFASKIPSAVMESDREQFGSKLKQITGEIAKTEDGIRKLDAKRVEGRRPMVLLKQLRSIHG